MTYIINPMVFYWIGLFDNISDISFVILAGGVITLGILIICHLAMMVDNEYKTRESQGRMEKFIKNTVIIVAISASITVLTPSESTMYKMLIASQVTVENIDLAKTGVTDLVDYIVEKVDEMQKEDEK